MKVEVFMDLDNFDKKILSMAEKQKNALTLLAKRLLKEEKVKISKITYNWVMSIWNFSPYQNIQRTSSKKFNELMGRKNPNLRFIYTAVKKVIKLANNPEEVE